LGNAKAFSFAVFLLKQQSGDNLQTLP